MPGEAVAHPRAAHGSGPCRHDPLLVLSWQAASASPRQRRRKPHNCRPRNCCHFCCESDAVRQVLETKCCTSRTRKCAPYSLLSFFLTVVPKASNASGTGCFASRRTLMSSPARGLSVSPLKNVCAAPGVRNNLTQHSLKERKGKERKGKERKGGRRLYETRN